MIILFCDYLLRICNIRFIFCLCILLHTSVGLLYNNCKDGLKIQLAKVRQWIFSNLASSCSIQPTLLPHKQVYKGKVVAPRQFFIILFSRWWIPPKCGIFGLFLRVDVSALLSSIVFHTCQINCQDTSMALPHWLGITGQLNTLEFGNGSKHAEELNSPLNTRISYSVARLSLPRFLFHICETISYTHQQKKLQKSGNSPPLKTASWT